MGSASWLHWVVILMVLPLAVLPVVALVRILNRLGLSPAWAVLWFIPVANVIGLVALAYARWPAEQRWSGKA